MNMLSRILRHWAHHLGNVLRFFKVIYLRAPSVQIGRRRMISFLAKIDTSLGRIFLDDSCSLLTAQ